MRLKNVLTTAQPQQQYSGPLVQVMTVFFEFSMLRFWQISKSISDRSGLCRMEFFLSGNGDQALPFELQAFEVPLAAAVRMFESDCNALEDKLLPSLERLTAKVKHTAGHHLINWPVCYSTGQGLVIRSLLSPALQPIHSHEDNSPCGDRCLGWFDK